MSITLTSLDDRQRLLGVLLKVRALDDSDTRDDYVGELEAHLGRPLNAKRFAERRPDLDSVLSASLACSGGLMTLIRILASHHPDHESIPVLMRLCRGIERGALLSHADRDSLRRLLSLRIELIAAAAGELVEPGDLAAVASWLDMSTAIEKLERLPTPDDGVPQLLTFVDRLAHIVADPKADALRQWTELVAGGLGVDAEALRAVRAASRRSLEEGRLAYPSLAPSAADGPTGDATARGAATPFTPDRAPSPEQRIVWGNVPIRNRNFTGREALLDALSETLNASSKASVLPQAVRGLGGVGKTQLVVEYVYRYSARYEVVWWIAAEQIASVLSELAKLAERLNLPPREDDQQTAQAVLNELATSKMRWLLVYDNAEDVAGLTPWVPSAGGHVILTSRDPGWPSDWRAIEVDVFERKESIEFLQKRGLGISEDDANALAEKLGDLPLALEQAAAWQRTTRMPIPEYVELLDSQVRELLSEGRPAAYESTVAAFVSLAVQRLRTESPATAELMELFAFLGPEPVSASLLRRGKQAEISAPLKRTLNDAVEMGRLIRELPRYGLAKVDAGQRIQVHRLVQRVLRESLPPDLARRSRENVQRLLAAANPGDPDELIDRSGAAEMGPHIGPAELVSAEIYDARQVVIDHTRYLYLVGDYEGSRRLAAEAAERWSVESGDPRLGPNGEFTLLANRHLANALRSLGKSEPARQITSETYQLLVDTVPAFGPRHKITLVTGNQVGQDMRIAGDYQRALEFDREAVDLHVEKFGPSDRYTLRAKGCLGVDYRMVGNFPEAYRNDEEVADEWEKLARRDPQAFLAQTNIVRDLYGMGRYHEALDRLDDILSTFRNVVGPTHTYMLLAERTLAVTLRKAGRLEEARESARTNLRNLVDRFGPDHEHSVAAAMTYANALRATGHLEEAAVHADDAHDRYLNNFGGGHPVRLCAAVNLAALRRARGELAEARALDEECHPALVEVLGSRHPYTLCVAANIATDRALHGDHRGARDVSLATLEISREVRGEEHPYTLICAANAALDLQAAGDEREAETLRQETLDALTMALGTDHPEVVDALLGNRLESDIEPPPT